VTIDKDSVKGSNSESYAISPPLETQKERCLKRRHTVGGTDEHLKALKAVAYPHDEESPRSSA
jgi:hypothetical protein